MGVLPDSLGSMDAVDWIPLDTLTDCLAGLAVESSGPSSMTLTATLKGLGKSQSQTRGATYLHLVNPKRTSWSEKLCPQVVVAMDGVKVVSLTKWVHSLEAKIKSDIDTEQSSASGLLDFYRSLAQRQSSVPVFETAVACQKCPPLRNARAIRPEWLTSWIQAWIPSTRDSSSSTCKEEMSLKSENGVIKPDAKTLANLPPVEIHNSSSSKRSIRTVLFSSAQKLLERFEPPNVKVDQIRFQPVMGAAVRIALDAGWLGALHMDRTMSAKQILGSGQSIDLLGKLALFD